MGRAIFFVEALTVGTVSLYSLAHRLPSKVNSWLFSSLSLTYPKDPSDGISSTSKYRLTLASSYNPRFKAQETGMVTSNRVTLLPSLEVTEGWTYVTLVN